MRIADSHEFLELYRGDKDLRMGMEFLKLRADLQFASFAPDRLSPLDRDLFRATRLTDLELPTVPDGMELRLLPSLAVRFARKEGGGIFSLMPSYGRELAKWRPDVIIESAYSWLTPRSYQTYAVAKALDVPVVYYDPGDDTPINTAHRVMALWESRVIQNGAAIITFTQAGARRFVDKFGYPPERISVIPKPVDVGRFRKAESLRAEVRARLGLDPRHIAVGYLGRLTRIRGSACLLEAARVAAVDPALSELRFVFVGGTLSSSETQASYVGDCGDNAQVTGMIPNSEVPEVLAALDIVVFPDVTRPAGFPTAAAETMAAGKAMIVGIGSSTKLMPLRDGENALLVPPGSPAAILEALRSLAADPDSIGRLGRAVARTAETTMDYPVVAAKWLDIIEGARPPGL